ncbi:MAG: hypothetical protein LUD03_01630, partial [Firmicutes bacterium]|nr:hypothetical protein [Bacillota bacterium]
MGNAWIRVTNWLNGVKKPYRKLMTVPIKTGADEYNRAARREEVKALYEGGMPVANIARKLNVSIGAVRNDMKVL